MKSKYVLIWVFGIVILALGVFVYLILGDTPQTVPKITLSYFTDEQEISDSIAKILYQELNQNPYYWIGLEPEKNEEIGVLLKLKQEIARHQKVQRVFVDSELELKPDVISQIGATDIISVKDDVYNLGEKLQKLENDKIPYIVITAAIYSTSILKQNPIFKIKEKYHLNPMTFSFSYFPIDQNDEENMIFPCSTSNDDHSGITDWGCITVNKARSVRRKIKKSNPKPWIGLMDLTGEKDYMVLLKKK